MKGLSIWKIAEVTGGTLRVFHFGADGWTVCMEGEARSCFLSQEVASITTDSRKVEEGCLFGAILGERVDGHSFLPDVFQKGAVCALTEKEIPSEKALPDTAMDSRFAALIEVRNTQKALGSIAEEYLKVLQIPVVGITGSVGKTSTKEMIFSVLRQKYNALKTEGNFNNELGLPLTIFRIREDTEIAVLEMGISHFGEMAYLSRIARPDTAVITNIGTCHLEYLRDRDGVLKAKTEILEHTNPAGSVILNGNDDKLRTVETPGRHRVFFGIHSDEAAIDYAAGSSPDFPGDLRAEEIVLARDIRKMGFEGTVCRIETPKGAFEARIRVPGLHNVGNAAAAAAVGLQYGLSLEEIRAGIEAFDTISGRFRVIRGSRWLVIDDCYNANPMSVKASLNVLATAEGRRVAILGDMGELGETEEALHREVGTYTAGKVDLLIAIGALSKHLAEAACEAGVHVSYYPDVSAFLKRREMELSEGDSILVKASHFMKFSEIVEALT